MLIRAIIKANVRRAIGWGVRLVWPTRRIHLLGQTIRVRARTEHELSGLKMRRGAADPGLEFLADALDGVAPGSVVYDVGAATGLLSISAAMAGFRVVAFEPARANFNALNDNIRLNRLANVTTLQCLISDVSGPTQFYLGSTSAGSEINSLAPQPITNAGAKPIAVTAEACTLDALVASARVPPPAVMKVDVEGAELKVLAGASRVLHQYRPRLIIEVHVAQADVFGISSDAVHSFLAAHGYETRLAPWGSVIFVYGIPN